MSHIEISRLTYSASWNGAVTDDAPEEYQVRPRAHRFKPKKVTWHATLTESVRGTYRVQVTCTVTGPGTRTAGSVGSQGFVAYGDAPSYQNVIPGVPDWVRPEPKAIEEFRSRCAALVTSVGGDPDAIEYKER